jgi:hypothetical protein
LGSPKKRRKLGKVRLGSVWFKGSEVTWGEMRLDEVRLGKFRIS